MFLESSAKPIDLSLKSLVDNIEKTSPGISVLAARQFRYSLEQIALELMVVAPRKFNVLEEFILRASLEITPAPTEEELAMVFGLDPIFLHSTTANLQALNTLKVAAEGQIDLTPEGRVFYQKGSVLQPPEAKPVYAIADPLLDAICFQLNPLQESRLLNLPDLTEFMPINSKIKPVNSLSLSEIQQLVGACGLGFHVPASGKQITAFKIVEPPKTIWQSVAILAIFDTINEKLTLQFRRQNKLLESATIWLETLKAEEKISLSELFQVSADQIVASGEAMLQQKNQEVESRLEKVRQTAAAALKSSSENTAQNTAENSSPTGSATLIRDSQIRKQFLDTLKDANCNILIYSPWVTEEVVDDRFLQLLESLVKRGVWILIGHGIAREKSQETRPIPPEVEQKLAEIKTAEGLSAVQIFWLGNSHAKEVVVDRRIHLSGSHNWLSYRGDRLPRGETVYQVTIPEQVREAYNYLASRFQEHADSLWQQAVSERDASVATISLCIWGALAMEETGLQEIEKQQWLDLLPVWLKVACQGLRSRSELHSTSRQLSPESSCFPRSLSLLSQLDPSFSQIKALGEGWQKAIALIANCDRSLAIQLLSEPVWSDFTRLGIVSEDISSPDAFISLIRC